MQNLKDLAIQNHEVSKDGMNSGETDLIAIQCDLDTLTARVDNNIKRSGEIRQKDLKRVDEVQQRNSNQIVRLKKKICQLESRISQLELQLAAVQPLVDFFLAGNKPNKESICLKETTKNRDNMRIPLN